uniref:Uncharacterized protein n=1 Tax=Chromera velia CCMP2878 TaxID=1169474 RepID=A0A0G4I247_9ALVE|eukprot:Cvel_1696.t1-p1 / transcript=Cvel_1696.t1 / gene=Cvel_1696 / organism=Chromera_velia_CCMP2878 / gene_product=Putative ankyrin repeat protein MM_0045, putative / transcript_product=Putative ankyrin repeat protein MM_0045, putative / location=Cvel_scaffold61:20004-21464(+) / protein_length=487 / sequence_SO=supercontig / SO=protein_coding / is_pseudo=false
MEETAVDSPPTIEAYLERLSALESSIVSDICSVFRSRVEIVEKTLRAKGESESAAAAAAPTDVPRVCPEDVSVLETLEGTGREFSQNVKGQLGGGISRHVRIDVGYLYEQGIGDVIRDFQPVSPETTHRALADFVSGASGGDDFRLCLKAGTDVNGLVEGQTALIRAVCANHTEAFEMIFEDGADLEAKAGEVPEGVEGAFEGDTAVIVASRQGRWGMVRSLVAEGANVEAVGGKGKKALQVACEAAERQLDPVFDGHLPNNPYRLHYDPQKGDLAVRSAVSEVLKDLLTMTSDVADLKISARNYFDEESLVHFFSWHEFEELLLLSLSRGVDIDAVDRWEWTALMNIARRSRPEYVQILLDNGADVNRQNDEENSALTIALRHIPVALRGVAVASTEESFVASVRTVLEILLDRGANVNTRNANSRTALHEAAQRGVIEIVRFLIERGADLQVRDDQGHTPHDVAVRLERHPEVVALLVPPGAAAE